MVALGASLPTSLDKKMVPTAKTCMTKVRCHRATGRKQQNNSNNAEKLLRSAVFEPEQHSCHCCVLIEQSTPNSASERAVNTSQKSSPKLHAPPEPGQPTMCHPCPATLLWDAINARHCPLQASLQPRSSARRCLWYPRAPMALTILISPVGLKIGTTVFSLAVHRV